MSLLFLKRHSDTVLSDFIKVLWLENVFQRLVVAQSYLPS